MRMACGPGRGLERKKEYKRNAGERNCTHSEEGASWKEFTNDCRRTGKPIDEVRKIYEAVMKAAPDYDIKMIRESFA